MRKVLSSTLLVGLSLLLILTGCSTPLKREPAVSQAPQVPSPADDQYFIYSGDTIQIFVYGHPDLSHKILVPPSGIITYPFLGDIKVEDLTISQLRDKIQKGLGDGYIPNPQVSVNIDEIAGRKIYVLGEVNKPNVLYIKDSMDAIEAISQSGGFTRDANRSAVVLLRRTKDEKRIMDVLDLKGYLNNLAFNENALLKRGDILYVPTSTIADFDRFFMHLYTAILPFAPNIMQGIILAPRAQDALQGKSLNVEVE